jgi:3-oxoacyl-(acyl-carrier-protein) synthase III
MFNSQIVSVATKLGAIERKIDDIGKQVQAQSSGKNIPVHYIEKLTGVKQVFHRNEGENTSDLAVGAAKIALDRAGLKIADIDLLIFASASQDLIEPATSHIVSAQLGATNLPVFDVKNACNSFLNGMQVANSFIRTGAYKRVLIVSGETPSMAIRWNNRDREQFLESFAGFSMSDGGGAMVLAATDEPDRGILDMRFTADSSHWNVGTLAMGGSRHPRDIEATYFNMDGRSLAEAFLALGPDILNSTLAANNRKWNDFAAIGMHQVSAPYMARICRILDVPRAQIVETIQTTGNITSLSMPYQLELALSDGRVKAGDEFAFIGFAGGISTGLALMRI